MTIKINQLTIIISERDAYILILENKLKDLAEQEEHEKVKRHAHHTDKEN